MVIHARLCAERLGDASDAQELYLAVVECFPGTPAARFAQARLAP
jgi:TolA-binding protein